MPPASGPPASTRRATVWPTHYDAVGRLDYLQNEAGVREVDYNYDAAGRLTLKTLGNGVYTTYEYDHAGQLLHLVNYKSDGSILSRFDYTYDAAAGGSP